MSILRSNLAEVSEFVRYDVQCLTRKLVSKLMHALPLILHDFILQVTILNLQIIDLLFQFILFLCTAHNHLV